MEFLVFMDVIFRVIFVLFGVGLVVFALQE